MHLFQGFLSCVHIAPCSHSCWFKYWKVLRYWMVEPHMNSDNILYGTWDPIVPILQSHDWSTRNIDENWCGRTSVCVLSLLLRCSALTCSHHMQQSHHQSKEQVHLHVQPTLSLLSLSESVECVRWESLTGLKWRMDDHMWSCRELSGWRSEFTLSWWCVL